MGMGCFGRTVEQASLEIIAHLKVVHGRLLGPGKYRTWHVKAIHDDIHRREERGG